MGSYKESERRVFKIIAFSSKITPIPRPQSSFLSTLWDAQKKKIINTEKKKKFGSLKSRKTFYYIIHTGPKSIRKIKEFLGMSPGKQHGIVHTYTSKLSSAFEQVGCRQNACWKKHLEQATHELSLQTILGLPND